MALIIKSDEADRLARDLAAETGETLTEAVETAHRERPVNRRTTAVHRKVGREPIGGAAPQ
jgi:antitoxin VapB